MDVDHRIPLTIFVFHILVYAHEEYRRKKLSFLLLLLVFLTLTQSIITIKIKGNFNLVTHFLKVRGHDAE